MCVCVCVCVCLCVEIFNSVHLTLLLMPFTITWTFRSNDPPLTKYTTHKTHKENQLRRNDSADQQILFSRLKCLQSVRIVYNIRITRHELSLSCVLVWSQETMELNPHQQNSIPYGTLRFHSVLPGNLYFLWFITQFLPVPFHILIFS